MPQIIPNIHRNISGIFIWTLMVLQALIKPLYFWPVNIFIDKGSSRHEELLVVENLRNAGYAYRCV
jgi:hypothetical protein